MNSSSRRVSTRGRGRTTALAREPLQTALVTVGIVFDVAVNPAAAEDRAIVMPQAKRPTALDSRSNGQRPPTMTSPRPERPSAASVAHAPLPDRASGIVKRPLRYTAPMLALPRAILALPRAAADIAFAPVRGALWAYERYQVKHVLMGVLFSDDGRLGVYPLAFVETGFGLNAGVRFVGKDVFHRGERFKLRVSYGGQFRQIYSAKAATGQRFGRIELSMEAEYATLPRQQFFGVGNSDRVRRAADEPLLEPITSGQAIHTRYSAQVTRFIFGADTKLSSRLFARTSAALLLRDYEPATFAGPGVAVSNVYDTTRLLGFERDLTSVYGEVAVRYDSRQATSRYVSQALPSRGHLLSGYVGVARGIESDPTAYTIAGLETQGCMSLGASRSLTVRGSVQTILGGGTRITNVPLADLPRLGGPVLLRGYPRDRFRDRAATLATTEYQWELGPLLSAFAFVDAGRVWRSLKRIEPAGIRIGYGLGLDAHTRDSFVMRLQVASSRDGGVFLSVSVDPAYEPRVGMERK